MVTGSLKWHLTSFLFFFIMFTVDERSVLLLIQTRSSFCCCCCCCCWDVASDNCGTTSVQISRLHTESLCEWGTAAFDNFCNFPEPTGRRSRPLSVVTDLVRGGVQLSFYLLCVYKWAQPWMPSWRDHPPPFVQVIAPSLILPGFLPRLRVRLLRKASTLVDDTDVLSVPLPLSDDIV